MAQQEGAPSEARSWADWVKGLSAGQLMLVLAAALAGLLLWGMFNDMPNTWQRITNSPMLAGAAVAAIVVLIGGSALSSMMARAQNRTEYVLGLQQTQISELQAQVVDLRETKARMGAQIEMLKAAEEACQRRVDALMRAAAKKGSGHE